MVTIGNPNLPGTIVDVDSASSTGVNISAAAEVGLVGQAHLTNGTATANTVYEVRTPAKARNLFGDGSVLAEAIVDALVEGAYPVYAVAATETTVTNEDLSGLGQTTGTLANTPVSENSGEVSFTVDGTAKTTRNIYDDPSTFTPATDEVLLNPTSGEFNLDTVPSATADVDYVYYDFDAAIDALIAERRETIDVIGLTTEDATDVDYAHQQVKLEEAQGNLMIAFAGADTYLTPSSYTAAFDSSRMKLVYPTRTATGDSVIGGRVGLQAALGINESATAKRMTSVKNLRLTLSKAEQVDLINAFVEPLADEAAGARIVKDVLTVADSNAEESEMRQALHRLIVDFVTASVQRNSDRFIGKLHVQSTRNALRSTISAELNRLLDLQVVTGYTLSVEEIDARSASVDVGVKLVQPLENVEATILAGEIEGEVAA
jgi:hypothetical protein